MVSTLGQCASNLEPGSGQLVALLLAVALLGCPVEPYSCGQGPVPILGRGQEPVVAGADNATSNVASKFLVTLSFTEYLTSFLTLKAPGRELKAYADLRA
ncbi:hypothetical protein NUW58_g10315 [Xylaria curta]|uniref:Uncharacterized protein n=1 Tax=Xylaria curta TaxID=42375 RepID=A0ACC1MP11_9PEZI|nr:hypothetical protein NUW58_g10315 [Xylaria curta]